jgi:hypothetical protein
VRIGTQQVSDVNARFFTTSCDPNMGHILGLFDTSCLKKAQNMILRKMLEIRIKQDKMLKDLLFFQIDITP